MCASFAAASLFVTVGGQLQARAIASTTGVNAFVPVTMPGPAFSTANAGLSTSGVGYSFTEGPTYSQININLDHNCSLPGGSCGGQTFSGATFTATAGTPWSIAGILTAEPGPAPVVISMDVNIIATPGSSIFRHSTTRSVAPGSSILVQTPISGDVFTGAPAGICTGLTTYTIALTISTTNNTGQFSMHTTGTVTLSLGNVTSPCYANCDGSTSTPGLTANDFTCFLNAYATGNSYANCDGSTVPPVLNANDFVCFLSSYAVGCS